MPDRTHYASKLDIDEKRYAVAPDRMTTLATQVLHKSGVDSEIAQLVAQHLVAANLSGIESHGVVRLMQYTEQFESGYMHAGRRPRLTQNENGAWIVDGDGGIGIPAMILAVDHGCSIAKEKGISATAIGNCGHTGRLGAYAERGANSGCLTIIIGGGGREAWRQVVPYGGRKAVLPTNPYAFGIPGGKRGPVVLDFATSKIAGGWIYAAQSAQTLLPESAVVDRHGNPTRKPEDYFQGGAILPFGGAKGYGLGVMAELIGAAMLGPVTTEMNWLQICIDTSIYRQADAFQSVAEDILRELRECPPAPGFDSVEVPGERERDRQRLNEAEGVLLPVKTWQQIVALASRLGVSNT